ncbi:uncharacterized protein OCT59_017622 [Rhizophagus irregularis]|uniref:uncharacterized protein n=1 Tax=Rhizophagus irregularis TaxID=588596 RepID=UPI0033312F67|nr:hypothetical protein OCT59_017622 [Rhizophagus irregularis]
MDVRKPSSQPLSLLDHYDEAQLPDDADPDYFERFIIYARDSRDAGGDGELNDCLYECLKNIYGALKMLRVIEKPDISKALGTNRDARPVSCVDEVEQLAGSLAINIVGRLPESLRVVR